MPTINKWIFTSACPMDEEQFFLASLIDESAFEHPEVEDQLDWDNIDYEAQSTLWFYSPKYAKIRGDSNPWTSITLDWKVAGLAFFQNHETQTYRMCVLSEDGDLLLSKNQTFDKEKIAEDIYVLTDLQQIGEHLYACGLHGQVYKRLGDNQWQRIDNNQIKAVPLKDYEPYANEEIGLSKINGLHENAVYAVGFQNVQTKKEQKYHTIPKAYFYNGEKWTEIELPDRFGSLRDVYVESEKRVWICGENGTLFFGNVKDGFKDISSSDPIAYFLSITMYRGYIWLVTPNGAYIYEPQKPEDGICKAVLDISPDLQDCHKLFVCEETLWSIGYFDIARFDGEKWHRIRHPENIPIGLPKKQPKKKPNKQKRKQELVFYGGIPLSDNDLWFNARTLNGRNNFIATYRENDEPKWNVHQSTFASKITRLVSEKEKINGTVNYNREGELFFFDKTKGSFQEQIPNAGDCWYPPQGWRYINGVRQIGRHLYACGSYAMVHKRFGHNYWFNMDKGIQQLPETTYSEIISFEVVDGPNEQAIYAAGNLQDEHLSPVVFFYNGATWRELQLPEGCERITDICVESDTRIWMCGVLGTLLVGNADGGFQKVVSPEEHQRERNFEHLCFFQDNIYVATKEYLYVCCPKNIENGIEFVVVDIDPPIRSIADIQTTENTLWIIGDHEIARFDGKNWQRLDYPDNEDYTKILKTNDPEKQNEIGSLYFDAGNYKKAVLWYEKSAQQGNKYAQNTLGYSYYEGYGVEQDYKRAFEWFEKSAKGGWYQAQGWLGYLYLEGIGTQKDDKKAFEWYYKATQYSWSPEERECVGYFYENGIGTEKNEQLAFEWYTKAAEQKHEIAQRKLGIMCEEGRGVEKDLKKAKEWYEKAIKNGDEIAKERLENNKLR